MKAKRRHELKENVLAHELVRLKQFFNAYGSWIVVAVLLAAVAVLVVTQLRSRQRQQYAQEDAQLDRLMTERDMAPEDRLSGLADLAANARNADIGARAAIQAGNAYLSKYINARDRSGKEARDLLDKAAGFYQIVLDRHGGLRMFPALAHFGLAEVAENRGDFGSAKTHYAGIAGLAKEDEPVARNSRLQLEKLPGLATSVPFATTRPAEPTTEPATQPAEKTGEPATTAPAKDAGK